MNLVGDPSFGRPLVKRSASDAPSGRSAPSDADVATEVAALAALLAEVVRIGGNSALFPSRWELTAELALEHDSAQLCGPNKPNWHHPLAGSPPLDTEHIITQLNELHELIEDDHA
jgi:hypothetical protein